MLGRRMLLSSERPAPLYLPSKAQNASGPKDQQNQKDETQFGAGAQVHVARPPPKSASIATVA